MWKALIKLVEKWSYRCEHDWEDIGVKEYYEDNDTSKLPIYRKYMYRCRSCCEFKTYKI